VAVAFATKAAAQSSASATSVPLTHPASLAAGDLMLAYFLDHALADTSALSAEPSGWSAAVRQRVNVADNDCTQWWSWKVATAGDVAAGSSTWTFSAAQAWHTPGVIRYTGADTTSPINQSAVNAPAAGSSQPTSSVTPTVDNCLIAAFFGLGSGSATWTLDASLTSRYNASLQSLVITCGDVIQPTAAAVTKTSTTSGQAATMLIAAIMPLGATPPMPGPLTYTTARMKAVR
jgi:hypothetical protein